MHRLDGGRGYRRLRSGRNGLLTLVVALLLVAEQGREPGTGADPGGEPGDEGGASGLQFNMGYAANDA